MFGLLGKITHIKAKRGSKHNFDITFEPVAILPERRAVPKRLAGKKLKLERRLSHRRELGEVGDPIVISVEEASKWLFPLAVEPSVARGHAPSRLKISLRWRHDKKPPEFEASVPGCRRTGKFKKLDNGEWEATLRTDRLFHRTLAAPFDIRIKCDDIEVWCAVIPADKPSSREVCAIPAPLRKLENDWYSTDVTPDRYAGGLVSFVERGRGVEHFPVVEGLIQHTLEQAGLCARCRVDFGFTNEGSAVIHSGSYISSGDLRAVFEGEVEPGSGLRIITDFTLAGELPILIMDRRYAVPKKKKSDKPEPTKGASPGKPPNQPVDELYSLSHCTTALWSADEKTRVLWVDRNSLTSTRPGSPWFMLTGPDWKLRKGWLLAENGDRTRGILFMMASDPPARMVVRRMGGYDRFIMEQEPVPLGPGEGTGGAVAVTAGETWGASDSGAWIGMRIPLDGGGVRCSVIARLHASVGNTEALVRVGRQRRSVPMKEIYLPGIGPAAVAVIDIPGGTMRAKFDAEVDGIPSRR